MTIASAESPERSSAPRASGGVPVSSIPLAAPPTAAAAPAVSEKDVTRATQAVAHSFLALSAAPADLQAGATGVTAALQVSVVHCVLFP